MTIDMTFEHREEIIRKEERAGGIVSTVKSLGGAKEKAVEIIIKELDIAETEAKEIVDRYWDV